MSNPCKLNQMEVNNGIQGVCRACGYMWSGHSRPMTNQPEKTEAKVFSYNAREYGKSFKQWQLFIAACKNGQDAVYRMTEGNMCSPARVQRLLDRRQLETLERLAEKQMTGATWCDSGERYPDGTVKRYVWRTGVPVIELETVNQDITALKMKLGENHD